MLFLGVYVNAMIKTLCERDNRERMKVRSKMSVASHGSEEAGEEDCYQEELHGNMEVFLFVWWVHGCFYITVSK